MRRLIDPVLIIGTCTVFIEHNQMSTHSCNRMGMSLVRGQQIANHRIAVQQIIVSSNDIVIGKFLQ